MKITRLQRILHLISLLQTDRYSRPNDLAQELGIDRRTVFRDLKTLKEAGIPYYFDEKENGYKLDSDFLLPPLDLTLREALSLLLVARHMGQDEGLPLQKNAQKAAMKIESALPNRIQRHCGSILKATSVKFAARARHNRLDETFSFLQEAIRRRRKVKMTYNSFYEQKQIDTTLSPYHLYFAKRAWYVIGYSSRDREERTYKLVRIKKLKLLGSLYLKDRPFQIDRYLGKSWLLIPEGKIYKVKLLFSAQVAGNVAEVLWHQSQKLAWHNDGRLTFEAEVDGLGEIIYWILGYGDYVKVLEPAVLRQRVVQTAKRMVKRYEQIGTELCEQLSNELPKPRSKLKVK